MIADVIADVVGVVVVSCGFLAGFVWRVFSDPLRALHAGGGTPAPTTDDTMNYTKTDIEVEHSLNGLRALVPGTLLCDIHGTLIEFVGCDESNQPQFNIARPSACWESGYAPVEWNRSARFLPCSRLFIAQPIEVVA